MFNDTRVIPARLFGRKPTGGRVELLLVERLAPGRWKAWLKGRVRAGTEIIIASDCTVRVEKRIGREAVVIFTTGDDEMAIERYGEVPLPPYLGRAPTPEDRVRYQTVFARTPGAVAAPTAGLHFTETLLRAMEEAGARLAWLTLHVGPGTFAPVETEAIEQHRMHEERFFIPEATASLIREARQKGSRIVAVGTTVVRALESAADEGGQVQPGARRTRLFIRPGYRFRVVDALLTNFHLPRSTLLMLVCAFAGYARTMRAYEEAKAHRYRFYSYGDAMFIPARWGDEG
ncbi:MAG: tRNA preQ1(34) S-adenosylmethionine ribosyltransferase-isomerase QueA [Zetaproteobacteria bacterium]|nr:MAG: tRNA preQ1(34) S-adenosylmethionine ribosyltransferase-isomerase QueA [Zetaproteobacteria bacterium]